MEFAKSEQRWKSRNQNKDEIREIGGRRCWSEKKKSIAVVWSEKKKKKNARTKWNGWCSDRPNFKFILPFHFPIYTHSPNANVSVSFQKPGPFSLALTIINQHLQFFIGFE
ncbi:hypothetical protein LXL04_036209 [Taraxacum kok-saghyz]